MTDEEFKAYIDKKEIYYVTGEEAEVKDRFEVKNDKIIIHREVKLKQPLEYVELNLEVSNEGVKVNEK